MWKGQVKSESNYWVPLNDTKESKKLSKKSTPAPTARLHNATNFPDDLEAHEELSGMVLFLIVLFFLISVAVFFFSFQSKLPSSQCIVSKLITWR